MATAGTPVQSEAGGKSPGSLRGGRSRRRQVAAAQLVMLWGAAAALTWAPLATASAPREPEVATVASQVRALSGSNWSLLLQGQWMVEFYAPWCPACQQMESTWEAFARESKDLEIGVGKVDVTLEPGVSGRFFVTTLPTIYHAKDGVFRRYRGSRTLEDLEGYIQERKWEAIEPVAGWKSPTSIIMHGMAGLFHLSGWIRLPMQNTQDRAKDAEWWSSQIHNYLTDTLGIHVWGSYAVFILATLLIGLILGLLLVLLADCISPPQFNTEEPGLIDQGGDVVEQETLEQVAEEEMTGEQLSDGEEDESRDNSSDDSAVEESATEEDSEQHAPHKVEQSSVRQRPNQAAADEL